MREFKPHKANFLQIDIEEFDPKTKFDIVIVSEVIEHVLSPTKLLQKVASILKDDGYAIISYQNVLFWKERLNFFLFGKFKNYYKNNKRYSHTNIFTIETFITLIELEGLTIEKRWPSFYIPFPKINFIKYRKNYSNLFDYGVIWVIKKYK